MEYVNSSVEEKRENFRKAQGSDPKGNPYLVYKSEFVEGWEPSGVPVSLIMSL